MLQHSLSLPVRLDGKVTAAPGGEWNKRAPPRTREDSSTSGYLEYDDEFGGSDSTDQPLYIHGVPFSSPDLLPISPSDLVSPKRSGTSPTMARTLPLSQSPTRDRDRGSGERGSWQKDAEEKTQAPTRQEDAACFAWPRVDATESVCHVP